jgi:hypothetical protein
MTISCLYQRRAALHSLCAFMTLPWMPTTALGHSLSTFANAREFQRFVSSQDLSWADSARMYERFYECKLLPRYSLEKLIRFNTKELHQSFEDLYIVAFYTAKTEVALHLSHIFELQKNRGSLQDTQPQRLYDILYYTRLFSLATKLGRQFPALIRTEAPIRISSDASIDVPSVIQFTQSRTELFVNRFYPNNQPTIIMVGHPLCHFSRSAIHAIKSDNALLSRMAHQLIPIAPPRMPFEHDEFNLWNSRNPTLTMSVAYHWRGWTMLDMRQTPVFYFLHTQRVRYTVIGWRDDRAKLELYNGLRSIGL